MKYMRVISIYGLIMLLGCGCSLRPTVSWEFEEGFSGLIKVAEVGHAPRLVKAGGKYRIVVPASGLVEVRSLGPLNRSHKVQLQPPVVHGSRAEDGYGFHFLISPPHEVWAFVGGLNEVRLFHENPDVFEASFEEQMRMRSPTVPRP
jgi:hypothetical protein